jgi:hypothetical protein
MSNPNTKDLSIEITLQQLLGSSKTVISNLKNFGFNIDHEVLR